MKIDISTKTHPNTFMIIDDEDVDKVAHLKWCTNKNGYALRTEPDRSTTLAHRIIIGAKDGEIVDHIDGNRLNNKKSNLRIVNNAQNAFNMQKAKHNTSGYKGVSWHKGHKNWQACVYSNKTSQFLGSYITKEEAAVAYNIHARATRGEYALLNNVPNEAEIYQSVLARMQLVGKGQKGQPKMFKYHRKITNMAHYL
jgi:hypothetical protein